MSISTPRPADAVRPCPVCGAPGAPLYEGLRDRLFGAPGVWRMARCGGPECGLLWLDPPPDEDALERAYQSYYTHASPSGPEPSPLLSIWRRAQAEYLASRFGYASAGGASGRWLGRLVPLLPGRRESLDASIMLLPARPGGRVLDVGCGSGAMLERLRDLGWRVQGVDPDPRAAAVAGHRGIPVHTGTLEEAAFEDGAFDAIIMNHVIEHVPDPHRLLGECRRILCPGGVLVASTPNAAGLGHRRFGRAWRGLEPPRHLQVFTPSALRHLAEATGFTIREIRTLAQIAPMIFRESLRPETAATPRRLSPWFAIRMRAFAAAERARLRTDPFAGEEIFLVAQP